MKCEAKRHRRPPAHRYVLIRHGDLAAEVDKGIAPVILETWRAGLRTLECCQGRYDRDYGHKRAYIAMPAADAERWLEIVAPEAEIPDKLGEDDPLTTEQQRQVDRRLTRIGFGEHGPPWTHSLLPYHDDFGGEIHVRFSVLIEFPASELEDVLALLRKYNGAAPAEREAFDRKLARAEDALNYACGAANEKPHVTRVRRSGK